MTARAVRNVATGTAYASGIGRLPGGPISALTYGNGRTLAQAFDQRYEPLEVRSGPLWLGYTPSPAGDVSLVWDRSEDPAGCVNDRTRTFGYDFQDRLVSWKDAVTAGTGTCPSEGLGSAAAAFTYVPGTDRIASQVSPDLSGKAVFAFGYDGQGSISAIGQYDEAGASIARAVCLRHDALGRLVMIGQTSTAFVPGGTACTSDAAVTGALARYRYDGQNRRIARQVNSQWTYTVFDAGGSPLSEFALTSDPGSPWAKVRDYVWLDGRLLAQAEYTGGGAGPAYTYYAHVDHLGTPRMLTNEAGELVWSTFQRPYGEVREKTKVDPLSGRTVVTNLRLPGQYDERVFPAAGLGMQGPYYNWNRWYLPRGRYLEPDPIALEGGLNGGFTAESYTYAAGNPLTYTDPEGKNTAAGAAGGAVVCGPVCAAIGAAIGTAAVWVAACTATNTCPWSQPICRAPPRPPEPPKTCEQHRLACIAHGKISVFYCDQCARICEFSPDKQWPWDKPGGFCQY